LRDKSKKSSDRDKIRELEQELKKEREKNALLMGKGAYSTHDQITPVVSTSYHLHNVQSSSSTSSGTSSRKLSLCATVNCPLAKQMDVESGEIWAN
jgi:hypothetical protein